MKKRHPLRIAIGNIAWRANQVERAQKLYESTERNWLALHYVELKFIIVLLAFIGTFLWYEDLRFQHPLLVPLAAIGAAAVTLGIYCLLFREIVMNSQEKFRKKYPHEADFLWPKD
jgi:hypothetical protein